MMSDPAPTMVPMLDQLEELVTLSLDQTTLGQIEFLDHLNTLAVAWTTRPGDIDRVGTIVYELVTEIAALRTKANT